MPLAQAQSTDYRARALATRANINRYFLDSEKQLYFETNELPKKPNGYSFLWPLCALLQGANELAAITNANDLDLVHVAIEKYNNAAAPAAGYQAKVASEGSDTRYYDDNQWIGIAAMDVFERTQNKVYLNLAKKTYRFMMSGFDERANGGIYWREGDQTTKNTCSNGPGILLALQLYKVTKEKAYLDTAFRLYEWTNEKLQAPDGLFFDAIRLPSLQIDRRIYAYNSGTMLQANVMLYEITKEEKYLIEAKRIADAAVLRFFKDGKFADNYWFSAVLMRAFVALYPYDRTKVQSFAAAANDVWEHERDANGLFGKKRIKSLIDQAAMLEIYSRLAKLGID